ncbi:hypothetical protein [Ramlibacter sp.]|uniref:hypothetical protein n=1 Tax=Ramlibacter sp. TaxID=1917967 RepID=UPI002606A0CF|nr:hypothetical protein [Ramlibacter sp.]MDB5957035.1 hypothetical protein [Ramlibacter sp.]
MAFDVGIAWRALSFLMTGWLALFFGRTLRPGHEALITRIARVSEPGLPPQLVLYTRRLTAVWCAYFVLAALLGLGAPRAAAWSGMLVWSGTALLFLGEHWLRPHLFPAHRFPGVLQQFRDTLQVWRPARGKAP